MFSKCIKIRVKNPENSDVSFMLGIPSNHGDGVKKQNKQKRSLNQEISQHFFLFSFFSFSFFDTWCTSLGIHSKLCLGVSLSLLMELAFSVRYDPKTTTKMFSDLAKKKKRFSLARIFIIFVMFWLLHYFFHLPANFTNTEINSVFGHHHMICSKRFAFEHAVDFISILWSLFFFFFFSDYKNTCFMNSLPRCALFYPYVLHFDVTKMSWASRIDCQEAVSFAYRLGKKSCGLQRDCFYLCGVNFWKREEGYRSQWGSGGGGGDGGANFTEIRQSTSSWSVWIKKTGFVIQADCLKTKRSYRLRNVMPLFLAKCSMNPTRHLFTDDRKRMTSEAVGVSDCASWFAWRQRHINSPTE